jgi:hypothetical protein
MKPRPNSSPTNTPARGGPSLSFQQTVDLVERMHAHLVRQRVGALEIVSGYIDGDDGDTTERVTLVIDPATGASFVSEWRAA